MGGTPDQVPDRYALGSPNELLPIGLDTVIVQGTADDIVPPDLAKDYVADARNARDHEVKLKKVEGANHFDMVTPTSPYWSKVQKDILEGLDLKRPE